MDESVPNGNIADEEPNIGDDAELTLMRWAKRFNFSANRVTYDTEGWDFFVQLPFLEPEPGKALDTRMPRVECLVQVKAVGAPKKARNVTLRNWEKLVKTHLPAFYLILEYDKEGASKNLDNFSYQNAFLIHIDEYWIEKVLSRLREFRQEDSTPLNKKYLTLSWSKENLILPSQFKETIFKHAGKNMTEYIQNKIEILAEIGNPTPFALETKFQFDTSEEMWQTLVSFAIGKKADLPTYKMIINHDIRFDIPLKVEKHDEGMIRVEPPYIDVNVILHNERGSLPATFVGKLFYPEWFFPDQTIPKEYAKHRITFGVFEILLSNWQIGKIEIHLTDLPLADTLSNYVNFFSAFHLLTDDESEGCLVEILRSNDNQEITRGKISTRNHSTLEHILPIAQAIDDLWFLTKIFGASADFQVSLDSVMRNENSVKLIRILCDINAIPQLTFHIDEPEDLEDKVSAIPFIRLIHLGDSPICICGALAGVLKRTNREQNQVELSFIHKLPYQLYWDEEIDLEDKLKQYTDDLEKQDYNVITFHD